MCAKASIMNRVIVTSIAGVATGLKFAASKRVSSFSSIVSFVLFIVVGWGWGLATALLFEPCCHFVKVISNTAGFSAGRFANVHAWAVRPSPERHFRHTESLGGISLFQEQFRRSCRHAVLSVAFLEYGVCFHCIYYPPNIDAARCSGIFLCQKRGIKIPELLNSPNFPLSGIFFVSKTGRKNFQKPY